MAGPAVVGRICEFSGSTGEVGRSIPTRRMGRRFALTSNASHSGRGSHHSASSNEPNMEQPISREQHGLVDWAYIPAVAATPAAVGFDRDDLPTHLARLLSGGVLLSTVLTRAEWGVIPIIPFRTHLALDATTSALAVAAPWLFGFADDVRARNAFVVIGLAGLVVGALTRSTEMPHRPHTQRRVR